MGKQQIKHTVERKHNTKLIMVMILALVLLVSCTAFIVKAIASNDNIPQFTGPVTTADGTTTLNSFKVQWEDGSDDLTIVPETCTDDLSAILVTSYDISGSKDHEPGTIRIEMPYHVFMERADGGGEGTLSGTAEFKFNGAPYEYTIDESNNKDQYWCYTCEQQIYYAIGI